MMKSLLLLLLIIITIINFPKKLQCNLSTGVMSPMLVVLVVSFVAPRLLVPKSAFGNHESSAHSPTPQYLPPAHWWRPIWGLCGVVVGVCSFIDAFKLCGCCSVNFSSLDVNVGLVCRGKARIKDQTPRRHVVARYWSTFSNSVKLLHTRSWTWLGGVYVPS